MQNTVTTARRRMAGAVASSLALHALVLLLPFSWFLRHGSNAAAGRSGESGATFLGTFFAGALHGSEVVVLPRLAEPASSLPVTTDEDSESVPKKTVEGGGSEITRAMPSSAAAAGSSLPGDGQTGSRGAGSDLNASTAGEGGTGSDPVAAPAPPGEMAIRPREYAHPRIPDEIVRKRKISDFVLMQVLVGTDGNVRDVRVLRAIANCEECTQSAVDAAQRLRYDPVVVGGRVVEVWTVPFEIKFSYQR